VRLVTPVFELTLFGQILSPEALRYGLSEALIASGTVNSSLMEIEILSNATALRNSGRRLLQSDTRQVVQFRFTGESQDHYSQAMASTIAGPAQPIFHQRFYEATHVSIVSVRTIATTDAPAPPSVPVGSRVALVVGLVCAGVFLAILVGIGVRLHRRGGRAAEGRRRRAEMSETTSSSGADTVVHTPFLRARNPLGRSHMVAEDLDTGGPDVDCPMLDIPLTHPEDVTIVPHVRQPKAPLNGRWADEIDEEDQVAAVVAAIKQHSRMRLPAAKKHVTKNLYMFLTSDECPQQLRDDFEKLSPSGKNGVKRELCAQEG